MMAVVLATMPLLAMTSAPAPAGAAAPITLVVKQEQNMLRLSVLGLSDTEYAARYTLEVDGAGPSGRNRTTQGGAVTLRPGEQAVLLSVSLGMGGAGQWTATLIVTPTKGAPYRQQMASPRAPS